MNRQNLPCLKFWFFDTAVHKHLCSLAPTSPFRNTPRKMTFSRKLAKLSTYAFLALNCHRKATYHNTPATCFKMDHSRTGTLAAEPSTLQEIHNGSVPVGQPLFRNYPIQSTSKRKTKELCKVFSCITAKKMSSGNCTNSFQNRLPADGSRQKPAIKMCHYDVMFGRILF